MRLELVKVEPEIALGIKLHRLGIAYNEPFFGEATADMPQSRGEGGACFRLWPITPEKFGQPIPKLGPLAMEYEVGQQGLGFECGRLGQLMAIIADV
jgi:hypothetical protein